MSNKHPSGWERRKLATLAKYQEGYVNPSQGVPSYFGDDIRWLRAVDLNDSFVTETSRRLSLTGYQSAGKAAKLFKPGSLAISKSGTIGRLGILQNEMCGNRAVINIEPNSDIDTRFLFYSLMLHRDRIIQLADGSVQKNLYVSQLGLLDLFVPDLAEQKAIAETLGSLDYKIEHNRRTGRALEGLAQATFKAWFVDFEPVKAKAAGQTSFPGMSPDTFAALPDRFMDSELGPVPEGWKVRPIGDIVAVKGGGTPSTKVAEYWDGGKHFWATPKDLSGLQEPVLLSTARRITDAGAECISSGVLPENTVILSSRAPVGYTALTKVPVAVNQGFIAMTCDGLLPPHYVLHWTRVASEEIKSRASGTTFPEISKTAFRPIPAVVPTSQVVAEFESLAQSLFDLIQVNARQTHQLGNLRDYLLPKLLNGSVRVRA